MKQLQPPQHLRPILAVASIGDYAPQGAVDGMDAETLGAFHRLLCFSWSEQPPCTLPNDDAELALIARLPAHRWEVVKPSILRCFKPDQLPVHRLVNAVALVIYNDASEKLLKQSERNTANIQKRWDAEWERRHPPDIRPEPGGKPPEPPSKRRVFLRSDSFSAPAPLRPEQNASKRPAERSGVVAVLSAGARAPEVEEHARMAEWLQKQSRNLLEIALQRWETDGLISRLPIGPKAREMAEHPGASPATVETAIAICDAEIARRRKAMPGQSIDFRPFGKLVVLLGQKRDSRNLPPVEPYMQIRVKWDKATGDARHAIRAQIAIDRRRLETSGAQQVESGNTGKAWAGGA